MRRIIFVVVILAVLATVGYVLTRNNSGYAETTSTIVNKEVVGTNQYYFYVEYEIEGYEGIFTATIKVPNRTIYDRYDVGDKYVFRRPVS
jgi:hypothetical protein